MNAQFGQNIHSLHTEQNSQSRKFLSFLAFFPSFIVKQSKLFFCIPQAGLRIDKNDLR